MNLFRNSQNLLDCSILSLTRILSSSMKAWWSFKGLTLKKSSSKALRIWKSWMETTSKQYKSKWRRHRCRKKSSKTIIMELTSIKSTSSNPNQLMRKLLGPEGITKGMTKARILDHHPASITYCTILRLLTVTLLTRLIILRILQMM